MSEQSRISHHDNSNQYHDHPYDQHDHHDDHHDQAANKKREPSFGHCKHEELAGEEKVETFCHHRRHNHNHNGVIVITIIMVSLSSQ